jgi:hypothetical protein
MTTILHISDLHFGWDGKDVNKLADRKVCLEGLLSAIENLDSSWKPSIICVSGDIGWRGVSDNYTEAKEWLDQLLERCRIGYDRVIACPGNHDVFRPAAAKNARPADLQEADTVLGIPLPEHFLTPFAAYTEFCRSAGISSFKCGPQESFLVGERIVDEMRFVCLNSSWFAKDDNDKGKLWIGLPHLKCLEAHEQLHLVDTSKVVPITIAFMHHPPDWLHEYETHASTTRPNTIDYLAARSHAVLTGHTHGEVRRADRIAESAYLFTGGSAYAGASHFNSFRLLEIGKDHITHRSFEFDPRSAENKWRSSEARTVPLTKDRPATTIGLSKLRDCNNNELRAALKADAQRFQDQKSRLLRPSGTLPKFVPQLVSVRVSAQVDRFDSRRRLVREKNSEQLMPLYEAVRTSRRTLLLGDLGTGKSSLGASLVVESIDRSTAAIASIIPVKSLKLSGQFTINDVIQAVDEYFANQVAPAISQIKLKSLLESAIEVLLVLDGFDELDRNIAGRLLKQAASLPEHWPTIQIVATGRPVELAGVAYSDWRVLQTVPLNDDGKREFIKQELFANGVDANQVDTEATNLLRVLKGLPSLDLIANTPLTIRLLTSRLRVRSSSSSEVTLGDLLYELLLERLGSWHSRDDKRDTFEELEKAFPTPEAKASCLSSLALRVLTGSRLPPDAAKALLQDNTPSQKDFNKYRLADEALAYFEMSGVIRQTDSVEFPIQPLAEIAAAVGIVTEWSNQSTGWKLPDSSQWRVISFVGTLSRRKGWLDKLREPILSYVDHILTTPGFVPAACYIVVETADDICARRAVKQFTRLGSRPFTFFNEERIASARNIAKALWLAQDVGFDYFYNHYLDARYPFSMRGAGPILDVLTYWTALAIDRLTTDQKNRLSAVVQPFLATGEAQFFGILQHLALLVPEAFTLEDRIWFQSELLEDSVLGNFSTEKLLAATNENTKELVSKVLAQRSEESTSAALLWCELNPQTQISTPLIYGTFKSLTRKSNKAEAKKLVDLCRERLGNERWLRFARWLLCGDDNTASCGAAIELYNAGEQRIAVLGRVFMRALHDGGYIPEAETILSLLVKDHEERGVRWLASLMTKEDPRYGGHSAWWRILLQHIESLADGPSLLTSCIRSLGSFILPRYPEIREAFTRLFEGPRGQEFRDTLRSEIHSLDPYTRRGAAVTLASISPRLETDALFVAIRSRASRDMIHWNEWESFILTLDCGPSVLASLTSKLDLLEPRSRALALAILAKSKIQLQPELRHELFSSLLDVGNWHLNTEDLGDISLASKESLRELLDQLNRPGNELTETAASRLLEFHRSRLTLVQEAKCIALTTRPSRLCFDLAKEMMRIKRDSAFADALEDATNEITASGGPQSLLRLVLKTATGSKVWKDIVWTLLCDDSGIHGGSHEADDMGDALMQYGREIHQDAEAIGVAALECLSDPRMKSNRWTDAYHWLVVIADEFVGVKPEVIRDALIKDRPIMYSAATALIARLGEIPNGFVCDRTRTKRPYRQNHGQVTSDKIVEILREYSRDSDELHPNILDVIEESLFLPILPEETLKEFVSMGSPGILIAMTLRYCYADTPQFTETIPLLDVWGRLFRSGYEQKRHDRRLHEVWRMARTIVQNDTEAKTRYLAGLDSALVHRKIWTIPLALEILRIRGCLMPGQVSLILRTYAEHTTFLHEMLFSEMTLWISGNLDEATSSAVLRGTNEAIVILNEHRWDLSDGSTRGPWAFLLCPVIKWALTGQSTPEAEAVFLRGIKFAFESFAQERRDRESEFAIIMENLDPLLKRIPPHIIGNTIKRGRDSVDPAVRSYCRLISGFSDIPQ